MDEHYYNNPDFFMARANMYDRYDRARYQVYVGEYAVTQGCGQGNLIAALGEAAYMTGLERNSDVVVMASYAPLLVHPAWKAWNPDAIVFDAARAYGTPSYHVQAMFANHRADTILPLTLEAPPSLPRTKRGMVGVATWSTQAEFKDVRVVGKDGAVLFQSDFSRDMQGWKPRGGTWEVKDGAPAADRQWPGRAGAGGRRLVDGLHSDAQGPETGRGGRLPGAVPERQFG